MLYRVVYAIPSELRVIGVVEADSPGEAIEKIDRAEIELGRGPIIRDATDVMPATSGG